MSAIGRWAIVVWAWIAAAPLGAQDASACARAHADAQQLRGRGTLLDAREKLEICADSQCGRPISDECTRWRSEVEIELASIVFAVTDDLGRELVDVEITANGHRLTRRIDAGPIQLDPGAYQFRFNAAGFAPSELATTLGASEKGRIVRVGLLPSAARPRPGPSDAASDIPALSYVFGAISLAGFGAFAGFGLAGKLEYDSLEDSCAPTCSVSERAGGERLYVFANVGLGLGVAAAVAAALSYFVFREPSARAGARLRWQASLREHAFPGYRARF